MIKYVLFTTDGDGLGDFDTMEEAVDVIKQDMSYDDSIKPSDYYIDMREVKDDDSPSIILATFDIDFIKK